ncbi:hypothetical protein [Phaeobacter porticola]|uniref:Uncharacterized protein n=1 Tax=Phaeobacter porticola TaxID=1844006 RepID=A0A1L3I3S0_9RHOB|nr:hypothetical protein [Phaeobacter porticola]APG46699.1 hypothetical protein PhaeoP97_01274 [Phaeobacter porticola]
MTNDDVEIEILMQTAEGLEREILAAHRLDRLSLRPEFNRVLAQLRVGHARVPNRMVRLGQILNEEAAEDLFDNMPV